MEVCRILKPNVVLADIQMPMPDGTKPFVSERILPTIVLCIAQSRAHHLLKKNFKRLREHSGERPMIDRTKIQLMECKGWTEEQAYRYIRELSRRKGMSMTKIGSYLSVYLENHP